MNDDHMLLRRFAGSGDEDAFTELVRRHLGMVHGICLRRTGNRQLAEELTQNVFASLARKADSLKPQVLIAGWLHRAACLESLSALRSESSRLRTMKNYTALQTHADPDESDSFRGIAPLLDEALDALPPSDRDVVLLRFASGLTLRQIGESLGKSESAAQRHLQQVLEKLSAILRRRGVTTSAAALALFIGADFAKAAPASLSVASVSKAAIASAAATSGTSIATVATLLYIMKNKAIIAASVCLLAAAGSVAYVTTRPADTKTTAKHPSQADVGTEQKTSPSAAGETAAASTRARRERPSSEYPDLAGRFGDSRVRLAESASDNLIKITGSLVKLLEFQQTDGGKQMMTVNGGDPLKTIAPALNLNATQKPKVDALVAKWQADQLEKLRSSHSKMMKNRTGLMEVLLSGDAAKRGEIGTEEYRSVLDRNKDSTLPNLGDDGEMLDDQAFRSELASILEQSQMITIDEFRAKQDSAKAPGDTATQAASPLKLEFTTENPQSIEQVDKDLSNAAGALDGVLQIVNAVSGQ